MSAEEFWIPEDSPSEEARKVLESYDDQQLLWVIHVAVRARTQANSWVQCVTEEVARRKALTHEPPADDLEP